MGVTPLANVFFAGILGTQFWGIPLIVYSFFVSNIVFFTFISIFSTFASRGPVARTAAHPEGGRAVVGGLGGEERVLDGKVKNLNN
jgi:hypothetical protein